MMECTPKVVFDLINTGVFAICQSECPISLHKTHPLDNQIITVISLTLHRPTKRGQCERQADDGVVGVVIICMEQVNLKALRQISEKQSLCDETYRSRLESSLP